MRPVAVEVGHGRFPVGRFAIESQRSQGGKTVGQVIGTAQLLSGQYQVRTVRQGQVAKTQVAQCTLRNLPAVGRVGGIHLQRVITLQ